MSATQPASTTGGQDGAQTQAASKNKTAENISKMMSILSMAMGGVSIYNGLQQLKCCQVGCETGAAEDAVNKKTGIEGETQRQIQRGGLEEGIEIRIEPEKQLPPRLHDAPEMQLLIPSGTTTASSCPSRLIPANSKLGMMLGLLRSEKAQASACINGMLALLTGGLMMAMGLMGMVGAKKAGQNASTGLSNANSMGSLSGVPNASSSKIDSGTTNPVKIDPALLRSGQANMIMSDFEKKFGIARDDFFNSVANGTDPRDLLARAPSNPIAPADIDKAMAGADRMTDSQKKAAMERAGIDDLQKEMLAKLGPDDAYEVGKGGGKKASTGLRSVAASLDDALGTGSDGNGDIGSLMGLSPDVQAALAARELAANAKSVHEMTIFEVVHRKYRERTSVIHGSKPGTAGSGVASADGY
jgi:hypothetical protein